MQYATIRKPKLQDMRVLPNLPDYEQERKAFSWKHLSQVLEELEGGGFNMAHVAIDRHLHTPRANQPALLWQGKDGSQEQYTFRQLRDLSNQFAHVLGTLGVQKGDRIFIFLERIPELYIGVLGGLKAGAVVGPLFSAFGPEAVKDRLLDSSAKVLVTSPELVGRVHQIRSELPDLQHILMVNRGNRHPYHLQAGEISYEEAMTSAPTHFTVVRTTLEDFAIMHYTSGTTGKPKGAVHVHQAIWGHYLTAKYVLDLHGEDIYWCTADPGWVTGTSYGIFGPWSHGISQVVYEGGFNAEQWYRVLEKHGVTVWYTAPTAIRMLMKAGDELPSRFDLSRLRHLCSVGEPLNPEAVLWGEKVLGLPFHDNWWQTETGCIQIANFPVLDIKPGSMGKPMPGTIATILDESYRELPPDQEGHLALKPGWPAMFRTYWNKSELYASRFQNGWYITADRAWRDQEGYFWFVGRADDVINTAGHLVGPFEVESCLIEHPAVAEAGVIGKPDAERMEIVKAFVSLKDGYQPSEGLREEIKQFVRQRLAAHAYPRELDFLPSLPKTRSGKIMRRLLKARELGLPEGDTSTLED